MATFRLFGTRDRQAQELITSEKNVSVVMKKFSQNGIVAMATVDYNYKEMAYNFYTLNIKKYNITNFVYISMDKNTCFYLSEKGIRCIYYISELETKTDQGFQSELFNFRTNERFKIVLETIKSNISVLQLDIDVMFLKDPMPHLKCDGACDMIGAANVPRGKINMGFVLIRPTKNSINLYQAVLDRIVEQNMSKALNDQPILHELVDKMPVKWNTIVQLRFCDTQMKGPIFTTNMAAAYPTYVLFHVICSSTVAVKEYLLKELGFWVVDDGEYYSSLTRKYLTYTNPKVMDKDQLKTEKQSLRTAIILSYIMKRTLILPTYSCLTTRAKRHRACPLVYHFSIHILKTLVDYREHMFFHNPLVPKQVNESRTEQVILNAIHAKEISVGNYAAKEMVIKEKDVLKLCDKYSDYQVLSFEHFLGVRVELDPVKHQDFLKQLDYFLSYHKFFENKVLII